VSCFAEIGFSGGAQSCVPVSQRSPPTLAGTGGLADRGCGMWDNRDDISTRDDKLLSWQASHGENIA